MEGEFVLRFVPELGDVWLAKGINAKNKKKPWAQALVFSFCKRSSSVPEIKNMYTEVVRRLHGIGFTVVASVCDRDATNEKAIKELLKESKNKALKENKNYCEKIRRTVGRGHCFVQKYEIRKKYSKSERKFERCEQLRAHSEKF